MAFDAGTVVAKLILDTKNFTAGLAGAKKAMDDTAKGSNSFKDKITRTGVGMQKVGKTMTLGLTAPILGVGTAAAKTTADFDSSMSQVQAVTGATGKDFTKLRNVAKKLGAETSFSAKEAAEGMKYLGMAGYDTNQIIDAMPGLLDLAAASGTDLGVTSDIVSDAMTAFGLSADKTSHFADMVAKASASANTNVELLGESFKYAAPIATSFGLSAEETTTALAMMANQGIKGSQGGTALRGALTRLIKPSDDAAKLMDKLGIKIADAKGNMLPFQDVMSNVRKGFSTLTEEQRNQAAATIFGQEALSGMMAVINTSDEDFRSFTKSLENSDGTAKKMAETMLNNLKGSITKLKSALEGLMISIGDRLVPIIEKIVKKINDWVEWFNKLSDSQKDMVVKIGLVIAAVGPFLVVLGKILGSVSKAVDGFKKFRIVVGGMGTAFKGAAKSSKILKVAFAAITSPIGIVVIAIGGIITALVLLYKKNEKFRKKVDEIWKGIKDGLAKVWEGIKTVFKTSVEAIKTVVTTAFETIKTVITTIWEGISTFFTTIWDGIKTIFTAAFLAIKFIIESAFTIIVTIIRVPLEFIKTLFENIWAAIGDTVMGALTGIRDFFVDIWNGIVDFIKGIIDFLRFKIAEQIVFEDSAWNKIKGIVLDVWNKIKEIIMAVVNRIKEIVTAAWNVIKEVTTTVFNAIKGFILKVWEGIKKIITTVVGVIKKVVTAAWEVIKTVTTTVWNAIKAVITGVWNGIKTVIKGAVNIVKSIITGAWNIIKSVTAKVWGGIKKAMVDPIIGAKDKIKGVIDTIKGFFTKLKLKFPKIKMPPLPHFKLNGKFSLKPPSVPKLKVDWYSDGAIFNRRAILGNIGVGDANHGFGNNSEAIVPLNVLWDKLDKNFTRLIAELKNQASQGDSKGSSLVMDVENMYVRKESDIKSLARELEFYRRQADIGKGKK